MKTRNKLISVVLTLALLCPMLSFVLPLEANAVLAPDDGVSSLSSSNSIYEEWTFDDLDDGEAVTQGYIDSHINGSFDASMFKDTWTAVTDADSGRKYIRSSNSYFRLSDPGLLLLKNPYEVSFDLMVDSSSNNTDTSFCVTRPLRVILDITQQARRQIKQVKRMRPQTQFQRASGTTFVPAWFLLRDWLFFGWTASTDFTM